MIRELIDLYELWGRTYAEFGKDQLIKNAGWFDRSGVEISTGCLSKEDGLRIKKKIQAGDLFIVLTEKDNIKGDFERAKGAEKLDMIAQYCVFVIDSDGIHPIADDKLYLKYNFPKDFPVDKPISREAVRALLG